jgi:predicted metalloprotease with PDZ domain
VREWFAAAVESAVELDYHEALDWFGLQFRETTQTPRASLGATTRNDNGRLLVTQVAADGVASRAGFNVGDEILAIGEVRVRAAQLDTRLAQYLPGTAVSVLVARRDELVRLNVTLGSEIRRRWVLETRPDISAEQQTRLSSWLPQ